SESFESPGACQVQRRWDDNGTGRRTGCQVNIVGLADEPKRTSPPGGDPPPTQPCPTCPTCPRRASLPPASFPGCRQYGDADVPCGPWPRRLERDSGSTLREIRALKACDFECQGIDEHAVIASSRLDGNIAFEDVVPDELGIALQGIAPATSTSSHDNSSCSGGNHVT